MFLTDGTNIKIPRGDSADIKFVFKNNNDEPYLIPAGSFILFEIFTVKGAKPIIAKHADRQLPDGSVSIHLSAADTDMLSAVYRYTIKIKSGDESVCDTRLGFTEEALFAVDMNLPVAFERSSEEEITVTVEHDQCALPEYTGECSVTAGLNDSIILDTAGHAMTENITVNGLNATETVNAAGGITIDIGGQNA